MARTTLVLTLTISFLMLPFLIHAEVYKWKDDKGDIHFTDEYSTIPEKYLPFVEIQSFPEIQSSPKVSAPPRVEEKPTPAPAPKSPGSLADTTPRLFSGVISAVGGGTIAVTSEGEDKEDVVFLVSEDTKIATGEGRDVPLSELKAEMSVTVEYMKDGTNNRALSIRVSTMRKGVATRQPSSKPAK